MPDHVDVPEPLPVDADLERETARADEPSRTSDGARSSTSTRRDRRDKRRPDVDPLVVAAIFAGGFAGGATRYEIGVHWTTSGAFPWPTFCINVTGAFVLALLLVLVIEVFPPTKFVRPGIGTGFLGAYTTFSSLVVSTDELAAHHHVGTAVAYLFGSTAAGLLLAAAGLATGRWIATRRQVRRRA
jgi:fluoride exporter